MTTYERLSLIASFGALAVSVIAFGALAWQLLMLARATRLDHDRRRKQATMEYLSTTMDRRRELRNAGIPDDRDERAVEALVTRALGGDADAARLISSYLTIYNYLGVAAQSDAFDLSLIDRAWGGSIVALTEHYRPWITEQRARQGEPRLYEDLEWLGRSMTPRRTVPPQHTPRTPVP
ncbi:DUF4760 domain-containing protein [Streptomyces purpureus]|uniref:DUF4760 domain-containing protein n=1 Tax=Streptomyces purpureus TaxID=1951 RepID=UPI000365EDA4|nr:DUF4760 domain-containing protein [Streptomyces purpureus]